MLSFTSSLSPDNEAFVLFVTEKYDYKDKQDILQSDVIQKIDSYLGVFKKKESDENISCFDLSSQKKCFVIKVKNKPKDYYAQELGGAFFQK